MTAQNPFTAIANAIVTENPELARDLIGCLHAMAQVADQTDHPAPRRLRLLRDALRTQLGEPPSQRDVD